jgi:branched-chain amino acid aminotransferase
MFICLNGSFFSHEDGLISAANSSYRYGDGLFETIRCQKGQPLLFELHMTRLMKGMELLGYENPPFFSVSLLETKIKELLQKNKCLQLARVRLSVYRGEGGLFDNDHKTGYLIECWPLQPAAVDWNENGLVVGVYAELKKPVDFLSNLKTASFLIYSMAAQFAKRQRWNDAIVLNTHNAVADTTIANLFIVKKGEILTPSLDQGCVAGVMRTHLIQALQKEGIFVKETVLEEAMLFDADEIFLTNAIRGIRWVGTLDNKVYTNHISQDMFHRFLKNHA